MTQEIKVYQLDETKQYDAQTLKAIFDEHNQSIEYETYYKDKIKSSFVMLDQSKPVYISGYPYGYLKTIVKYSVETTNKGGRLVFQSQNPKNLVWNTAKKSTYNAIKFLIIDENGHIKTLSLDYNDGESKNKAFECFLPLMSKEQKIQYSKICGYTETMKHVTFKVTKRLFKHKVTGEIVESLPVFSLNDYDECDENGKIVNREEEKTKQKEIQQAINQNIKHESIKKFVELLK